MTVKISENGTCVMCVHVSKLVKTIVMIVVAPVITGLTWLSMYLCKLIIAAHIWADQPAIAVIAVFSMWVRLLSAAEAPCLQSKYSVTIFLFSFTSHSPPLNTMLNKINLSNLIPSQLFQGLILTNLKLINTSHSLRFLSRPDTKRCINVTRVDECETQFYCLSLHPLYFRQ